jgi:transposase
MPIIALDNMAQDLENIDYKLLLENSQKEVRVLQASNKEKDFKIEAILHELNQLKRMIFGAKNEKFNSISSISDSQLSLDLLSQQMPVVVSEKQQEINYTRTKKSVEVKEHKGRNDLPEHLERRTQIIEPKEDISGCKKIGELVTEELEYEPGKLYVNRIVRPKYVQEDSQNIIVAEMIDRPLPKVIAGAGLIAQILIDKFVDHIPLYRQRERFKREDVEISDSTMSDWVRESIDKIIHPVYHSLKQKILQSDYLHVDESPIKVLDNNVKNKTHQGYFWVYNNSIDRMVLFDYQPGRGKEGPKAILKDFKGVIQTDGYAVYDMYKSHDEITLIHCMAHARRMFFEAQGADKERAQYALHQIGLLYDIERKVKSMHYDEIQKIRAQESVPILEKMKEWMQEQIIEVLPKSIIGKAIAYSLTRWKELSLYTIDGKLNIDNNPVENSIRPVAIGRKNYLFAGNHAAAQRNAMIYSIVGTCKMNGINPYDYLKDIINRVPQHSINKIEELLPQNWIKQ